MQIMSVRPSPSTSPNAMSWQNAVGDSTCSTQPPGVFANQSIARAPESSTG